MPLLEVPESYLDVNGLKLRYCMAGSGEPLLLIHGLGAMMEYWYQNISVLAKKYQVIAFDVPGFGKSEAPLDLSLENIVNLIYLFLQALNIERLSVVGHSLGGALALKLVGTHRSMIHKLALMSNVGFTTQLSWMFRFLALPGASLLLKNISLQEYAATLRAHTANPMALTDDFVRIAYQIATQPKVQQVFLRILRENVSILGIKSKTLQSIQAVFPELQEVPMQIFWGKQDPVLFFESNMRAANRFFPKAHIITLESCGHIPQIEKSHLINEGLLEFL